MNDQNPSDLKQPASAGQIEIHSSPVVVHHEREAWLYENPEALARVRRGLEQSAKAETHSMGSFAKCADDKLDRSPETAQPRQDPLSFFIDSG